MTKYKGFHTWLKEFIELKKKRELSDNYIRRNEQALKRIYRILKDGGRYTEPERLTFDDVIFIRDHFIKPNIDNNTNRNARLHCDLFREFMRFCGKYLPNPRWKKYIPYRPRLEPEEYASIWLKLNEYNGDDWDIITGRVIVQLGSLAVRRIGILRLEPKYINEDSIIIYGKGPFGGTPRLIPIDPITKSILQDYLEQRKQVIKQCLDKKPKQQIPHKFLVWYMPDGRMGNVHGSKFDKILKQVSNYVGKTVTCHRLRRMACTDVRRVTKDDTVSMALSGHHDHSTFINYLGLNPDLKEAVIELMKYRQKIIMQVEQRSDVENELADMVKNINEDNPEGTSLISFTHPKN